MKGTLAIWYEPVTDAPADASRVELELHANLWRDLPSGTNFLDLGIMLEKTENMSRFYLYIPARITAAHLDDLSGVLRSGVTANAVFNDVVHFGAERDGSYDLRRGGDTTTVFQLIRGDSELEALKDPLFGEGTRITFTEQLCRRLQGGADKRYLRIRIKLVGEAAATFSSEVVARDRAFASSAGRLELTEFRLNERRSYPASFGERADAGRFKIKTIHYFLIRDLEHQLVVQHARFEKVRRLETALWTDYVASAYGLAGEDLTTRLVDRLVIYHWKAKPKPPKEEIGDFIAFASFRTTSTSLLYYAFVIVLLGAAGSVLAALLGELLSNWLGASSWMPRITWPGSSSTPVKAWSILLAALASAIALVAFLPVVRARFRQAAAAIRALGTRVRPIRQSRAGPEGDMK